MKPSTRKPIVKRDDIVVRLRRDADANEDHADDETGGSHITARTEREGAIEIEALRRDLANALRREARTIIGRTRH